MSGTPIAGDYIKAEGKAGRMGARLMAIVAEGERGRVYLPPTREMEAVARQAKPEWKPEGDLPAERCAVHAAALRADDVGRPLHPPPARGADDLLRPGAGGARAGEARRAGRRPARRRQAPRDGGTGATAYADAVAVYLAFAVEQSRDYWIDDLRLGTCRPTNEFEIRSARQAFRWCGTLPRQSILGVELAAWLNAVEWIAEGYRSRLPVTARAVAHQADAAQQASVTDKVVSTDPPYYDNIGYADLSDFFYVWLRRSLKPVFPDLFATLAVPKAEELVATPTATAARRRRRRSSSTA